MQLKEPIFPFDQNKQNDETLLKLTSHLNTDPCPKIPYMVRNSAAKESFKDRALNKKIQAGWLGLLCFRFYFESCGNNLETSRACVLKM